MALFLVVAALMIGIAAAQPIGRVGESGTPARSRITACITLI